MSIKAYSYIRFSTPDQIRGDSLRRQLEASRAFALERGWTLDESMRDLGVSAFTGAHRSGALGRFLHMVKVGQVAEGSILLVEHLDRLSREAPSVAMEQFLGIINAGVSVVTFQDRQIYDRDSLASNSGAFFLSLGMIINAHQESAKKAERLKAAWENKRQNVAHRPLTSRVPGWLTPSAVGFEIVEERAEIVRRIYSETIAGIGQHRIVARLNEERIRPFGRGKGWHRSYVQKLLSNEAVLGRFQPHTRKGKQRTPAGDPLEGYFPPIIDEDNFAKAQQARKARCVIVGETGDVFRSSGGRRSSSYSNLFSGLTKCWHCGAPMEIRAKGPQPQGGNYFVCSAAIRNHNCSQRKHFRYDRFEKTFLESVHHLDYSRLLDSTMDRTQQLEASIAIIRLNLDKIVNQINKLIDVLLTHDSSVIRDRIVNMEATRQQKATELNNEITKLEQLRVTQRSRNLNAFTAVLERMANSDGSQRYALRAELATLIRETISHVTFDGETGDADVYILFDEVTFAFYRFSGDKLTGYMDHEQRWNSVAG